MMTFANLSSNETFSPPGKSLREALSGGAAAAAFKLHMAPRVEHRLTLRGNQTKTRALLLFMTAAGRWKAGYES